MGSNRQDIIDHFNLLNRKDFMEIYQKYASMDEAFPIGYGQTISQPSLVLYMTLLLELEKEHRVLEIGTGSGYQTAMLQPFCKKLFTVEYLEPLYLKVKERLDRLGYDDIHYRLGDGSLGWKENAPFDRIIVTAAAKKIPTALIDQLATSGRMIIPSGEFFQNIYIVTKDIYGKVKIEKDIAVRFVELVMNEE